MFSATKGSFMAVIIWYFLNLGYKTYKASVNRQESINLLALCLLQCYCGQSSTETCVWMKDVDMQEILHCSVPFLRGCWPKDTADFLRESVLIKSKSLEDYIWALLQFFFPLKPEKMYDLVMFLLTGLLWHAAQ